MRGSEEPTPLEQPTTLTASVDDLTGSISAGTFSTPTISFMQHVTSPVDADVFIDASFREVAPQSVSGTIDHLGNVSVRAQMAVDLHVEVGNPAFLTADCTASPVNLNLRSTAPYDEQNSSVTLSDPNFSVPAVEVSQQCNNLVAPAINGQLAGGGHALTVTLEGELPVPPAPGDPTSTRLEVSPGGSARAGEAVVLEATVEPDEGGDVTDIIGDVEFLDGASVLGRVPVANGGASLTVDTLAVGEHELSARYLGGGGFGASVADPVSYSIRAVPLITADWPSFLTVGADPVPFDVVVTNPPQGAELLNGRVDLGLTFSPGRWTTDFVIEYLDEGGQWQTLPLGSATGTTTVVVGEPTGFALPPASERTIQMRIAATAGLGALTTEVKILEVDAGTGAVNSELSSAVDLVGYGPQDRLPSMIRTDPRNPPVQPTTMRPGFTPYVNVNVIGAAGAQGAPTGRMRYLLDGRPVQVMDGTGSAEHVGEWVDDLPVGRAAQVRLPSDLSIGTHTITAVYGGDANFLPISGSFPITVDEPIGVPFACRQETTSEYKPSFDVLVTAQAVLPPYALAGSEVDVRRLDVQLRLANDRGSSGYWSRFVQGQNDVRSGGLVGINFGLGQASGAATGFDLTANGFWTPASSQWERVVTFTGETASMTASDQPGGRTAAVLDRLDISAIDSVIGAPFNLHCEPLDQPVALGEVTAAGVDLDATPSSGSRVGDPVTLTAAIEPSNGTGTVLFEADGQAVALASVIDGRATATVSSLVAGANELRARFVSSNVGVAPSMTSEPVAITLNRASDCSGMLDPGSGAVVRLVYLSLLGRCPDRAGYDHWRGQLDRGVSREDFAKSLAYSGEALGLQVDRAYDAFLGRAPDAEGRRYWIGRLRTAKSYTELLAFLGNSGEAYRRAGSTNEGFVRYVYDRVLHRAPDPGGLEHWKKRLDAGTKRGELVRSFARQDEPLGALATEAHQAMLRRDPTSTERTASIQRLRATGDLAAEYSALIATQSFYDRAQGFPNLDDIE